jgi:hypothetical protein
MELPSAAYAFLNGQPRPEISVGLKYVPGTGLPRRGMTLVARQGAPAGEYELRLEVEDYLMPVPLALFKIVVGPEPVKGVAPTPPPAPAPAKAETRVELPAKPTPVAEKAATQEPPPPAPVPTKPQTRAELPAKPAPVAEKAVAEEPPPAAPEPGEAPAKASSAPTSEDGEAAPAALPEKTSE